jgi:hypothetical protein
MVRAKNRKKSKKKQGQKAVRNVRITANTPHGTSEDRLTAFGGVLALIKFLDLVGFEKIFKDKFADSVRRTMLGSSKMVMGILMLIFIGFQRLGHFKYIQQDPMVCGFLAVKKLAHISTFWRYLRVLGIPQSNSLLRINAAVRMLVWEQCGYAPRSATIAIDTTVSTVYGNIEGAKKGHNTKHRGKKGLRPILAFIQETREYIYGRQRRGETVRSKEVVYLLRRLWGLLPPCVKDVLILADGEMLGWDVVAACEEQDFHYVLANRSCKPKFRENGWYRYGDYDYNQCMYQPTGWLKPKRFVAMRIRQDQLGDRQLKLFDSDQYAYRIFVTNLDIRPHRVIRRYDGRANVENLVKEAQHEGILAIPSKNFHANHAFFQIVMMAYNIWRWMKMMAACSQNESKNRESRFRPEDWPDPTIRMIRLKFLFVAAKIRFHGNRNEVLYSIHETRSPGLIDFLDYLDKKRKEVRNVA